MRFVVHGDTRDVDIGGQLLSNLGYYIRKCGRRVDGEPELALFAHEPENHGCMYLVEEVVVIRMEPGGDGRSEHISKAATRS